MLKADISAALAFRVNSIQKYILIWVLIVICLGGVASLLSAIYMAQHESEEVFDASLIQATSLVDTLLPHEPAEYQKVLLAWQADQLYEHATALSSYAGQGLDHEEQESLAYFSQGLAVLIQDKAGRVLFSSVPEPAPAGAPQTGFHDVQFGSQSWRLFSVFDEQRQLWISSAQSNPLREYLGLEISLSFIPALSVAGVLLCFIIIIVVRKGMQPLDALSEELSQRDPDNLAPITPANLPRELNAPVSALNAMFARVDTMLERERRFTDDAAHELRTPLAAMRMFIHADTSNQTQLSEGVSRMERLINQLLELARLNPQNATDMPKEPVDLQALSADVVADLYPQAAERNIDIELQASEQLTTLPGQPVLLAILLRNLLENAIRYSVENDQLIIGLQQEDGLLCLRVTDHGPGLSDAEKSQVFERFYRAGNKHLPGAGLGMTIVKTIIELHSGDYQLTDTAGGGLTVEISLPL